MPQPEAIYAADPGLTTGWATWDGERIVSGQLKPMEWCEHLAHWTGAHDGAQALVVMESFTITASTLEKSRQTYSLELIGVGKWLAHEHALEFVLQKPADAKRFCPDSRLRDLGLWVPGEDHARDALRHLVLALAKRGLIRLTPTASV